MGIDDTCELVKINLWIQKNHFKLYSIYNPPRNIPDLSTIKTKNKTMIIYAKQFLETRGRVFISNPFGTPHLEQLKSEREILLELADRTKN